MGKNSYTIVLLCLVFSGVLADFTSSIPSVDYVHSFEVHNGPVSGLALFEDEDILVTTGIADKLINVWKLSDSSLLKTIDDHKDAVKGVIALTSQDGTKKYFASFSFDQTIKIWDLKTFELVHVLTGSVGRVSRAVHITGTDFLATVSGTEVRVWNFVEGGRASLVIEKVHGDQGARGLVYITKKNCLATMGWDNYIRFWDYETGDNLQAIPYKGNDKLYSMIYVEHLNVLVTADMSGVIYKWKYEQGLNVFVYQDYGGFFPIDMLVIPNSNILIVAGFESKNIKFLDITKYNTKVLYEMSGSTNEIWRLEYIKNSGYFLSTGADYSVRKWTICQNKYEYFNPQHGICVQNCNKKDISRQVCSDPVQVPTNDKVKHKKSSNQQSVEL